MSSPFGHSLAGYIIATFASKTFAGRNFRTIFLYIFIANAPDLDFFPGILVGKPNLYHHGISHSLGVGISFSIILALIINYKRKQHIKRAFLLFFILYCSHLFLDYMSIDGIPPLGIPLFYPLSYEYYISPYPILPPIMHSELDNATIGQFLNGVFSVHNLYVMFLEFIIMLPFMLILFAILRRDSKA
jgi:inner membrane protein